MRSQHKLGQLTRAIRYDTAAIDFKTIPSARFGQIVFHPRPEDEASGRRTIDYDGTEIVVR